MSILKFSPLVFVIFFQQVLIAGIPDSLKLEFYAENYFAFNPGNTPNNLITGFLCSYNRHNEVNLNIGILKASWKTKTQRASLGFMAGTYVESNLVSEPGVLKHIYEANSGIKISKKNNLWLEAGIFPSHIGFESAIGKECWNLTRSILADNSPYYETGIKLSYTNPSDKWFFSGMMLNGWQCIRRPPGNNSPAFGHQIVWSPLKNISLNSSSFIGNVYPDSARRMRYFHNFFMKAGYGKTSFILGFDLGAEQKEKSASVYHIWYSPVVLMKYKLTQRTYIAGRLEYYSDSKRVIIQSLNPKGFQTMGTSFNIDFNISPEFLFRMEGRVFYSGKSSFLINQKSVNSIFFLTGSLAVSI